MVKVQSITIKIGKRTIELSAEEFKELRAEIERIAPTPETVRFVPQPYAIPCYPQPWAWPSQPIYPTVWPTWISYTGVGVDAFPAIGQAQ